MIVPLHRLPALVAGLACATAVAVAAPADAAPAATRVRASSVDGVLKIRVTSDRAACERDRLVVAYIDNGAESIPGFSARTNRRGVVRLDEALPSGRLVAVATKTRRCAPAQSTPIRIVGQEES